jgi:hypothetical protein
MRLTGLTCASVNDYRHRGRHNRRTAYRRPYGPGAGSPGA